MSRETSPLLSSPFDGPRRFPSGRRSTTAAVADPVLFRLYPPVAHHGVPPPGPRSRLCCCAPCRAHHRAPSSASLPRQSSTDESVGDPSPATSPKNRASLGSAAGGDRSSRVPKNIQDVLIIHFDEYLDDAVPPPAHQSKAEDEDTAVRPPPPPKYPMLASTTWSPRNRILMAQIRAGHAHCFPVAYEDEFFETFLTDPKNITLLYLAPEPSPGSPAPCWFTRNLTAGVHLPFLPPPERGEMLGLAAERQTGKQQPKTPAEDEAGDVEGDGSSPLGRSLLARRGRHELALGDGESSDPRPEMRDAATADVCGQLLAFLTVRVRKYTGCDAHDGEREGYIATLGVRNGARSLGLARELVDACLRTAFGDSACYRSDGDGGTLSARGGDETPQPLRRMWLHCLDGNTSAMGLYLRRGFVVCDFMPAFYRIHGRSCDANILALARDNAVMATGARPLGPDVAAFGKQRLTEVRPEYDPGSFVDDPDNDSAPTRDPFASAADEAASLMDVTDGGGGVRTRGDLVKDIVLPIAAAIAFTAVLLMVGIVAHHGSVARRVLG